MVRLYLIAAAAIAAGGIAVAQTPANQQNGAASAAHSLPQQGERNQTQAMPAPKVRSQTSTTASSASHSLPQEGERNKSQSNQ